MQLVVWPASSLRCWSRVGPPHLARARGGWARGGDHSINPGNRSLYSENRPRRTSTQAAAGEIGHSVGQAATHSVLRGALLRPACRIYERGPPHLAPVGEQKYHCTQASFYPKDAQACVTSRPKCPPWVKLSKDRHENKGPH